MDTPEKTRHRRVQPVRALERRARETDATRTSVPEPHTDSADDPETAEDDRVDPRRLRRLLIASDALAIGIGIAVATGLQYLIKPVSAETLAEEALLALVIVPLWLLMMGANRLFTARAITRFGEEMQHLFMAGLLSVGVLVAASFVMQYSMLSRLWVGLLFVCVMATLVASRIVARHIFKRLRASGRISRPVILVGTGSEAISLLHTTQRMPGLGYRVLGFTGEPAGERGEFSVLGGVDDTLEVVSQTGATGVILSVASLEPATVNRLTRTLTEAGCHVTLSSSLHDIDISRTRSQSIHG